MFEGGEIETLSLEDVGDAVEGLVTKGESLLAALQEVGERAEDAVRELADPAAELAGRLGELSGQLGEVFGDYGERVGEFLQTALELAKNGTEWLAEHPEVLSAAVRLVTLVVFGIENPDQLLKILQETPGALEEILKNFEPLLRAIP